MTVRPATIGSRQSADPPVHTWTVESEGQCHDAVAVEALVDRLVHHSHILILKGDSYRLKDKHDELVTTNDDH